MHTLLLLSVTLCTVLAGSPGGGRRQVEGESCNMERENRQYLFRKSYFHENVVVSTEHSGKLLKPQLQKRMKIDDILVPLSHLFREF